jgi:DNA polymerase-1
MLVNQSNLYQTISRISQCSDLGLDTETYGLLWHHKLFSLQIACGPEEAYYFNFYKEDEGHLNKAEVLSLLTGVFNDERKTFYLHNAKFDLHMLAKEGIEIKGTIHCTHSAERLVRNDLIQLKGWPKPYSLAAAARRRGWSKDDGVEESISKNHFWEWVIVPGKKKKEKSKFYYKVPTDTLVQYGEMDAILALKIGKDQEKQLAELNVQFAESPDMRPLIENERKITKTLQRMEFTGIRLDRAYVNRAILHETAEVAKYKEELEKLAGMEMKETHFLKKSFDKHEYHYDVNEDTGNPIFDKEHLQIYDNPIAEAVRKLRLHEKYLGSFYSSFIYYADTNDIIHASANQSGTTSGRLSYSNPNLQNIPKEEEFEGKEFIVRKSFIPRPNYSFLFIDFAAQEFRVALDYAGEAELIEKINQGFDPHQATADMVGISRKQAKTLNFASIYGSGPDKIADFLKISREEAVDLRERYFSTMPKLRRFLYESGKIAKQRGLVWNKYGRRYYLAKHDDAYKIANNLIQGSCADVCKFAMNKIDSYLQGKKSQMVVQVHDELIIELHKDELDIQKELKLIMEREYKPRNGMYLTCSVEHSAVSWGSCDKVEGFIP